MLSEDYVPVQCSFLTASIAFYGTLLLAASVQVPDVVPNSRPLNPAGPAINLTQSVVSNYIAEQYYSKPVPTHLTTPALWLATVQTDFRSGPGGSAGFAQEMIDFVIPLSRHVWLGWKDEAGLNIHKSQAFWELRESDRLILESLNNEGGILLDRAGTPKLTVVQFQPVIYKHILDGHKNSRNNSYIIGRSMYETTGIPPRWAEAINYEVDEVWVPSQFAKDVFLKAGVTKKIVVIGEGFDPLVFNYNRTKFRRKKFFGKCNQDDFVFFSVGKYESRKGWDHLFKSFKEEFAPTDKVCLCARISGIKRLPDHLASKNHRMSIIPRQSLNDYPSMYRSADAFVLATHGEGWGRPIMEALSLGLPTIVPLWGGVTQFINTSYSVAFKVTELERAFAEEKQDGIKDHKWAVINDTALKEAMRWTYSNQEEARKLGDRAHSVMQTMFTRDQIALDAHNRMLEIERNILTPIYAAIHIAGLAKELNLEPVATESYLKMFIEPRVQLGSMKLEAGQLEEWLSVVDEITEVNNAMLMDPTLSSKYKRLIVAAKEGIHKKLIQNQGEFMERDTTVHESYQKVLTELLMYLPFEFPVEIDPSIEEAKKDAARKEEAKKAEEEVKKKAEDTKKAAEDAKKIKEDEKKLEENPEDVKKAEAKEAKEAVEAAVAAEADNTIVLDAVIPNKDLEADKPAEPEPVVAVPEEPVIKEEKKAIIAADEGKTDSLEERIAKREQLDQSNIKKLIDHKVR